MMLRVTGSSALLRLTLDHPLNPAAIALRRGAADLDGLYPRLRLRPDQVDVQQPVVEPGTLHLDPFGEHERPLKLPRRDAAVQEHTTLTVVILPAPDYQLVVFLRDLQVVHGKAGDSERDPQRGRRG